MLSTILSYIYDKLTRSYISLHRKCAFESTETTPFRVQTHIEEKQNLAWKVSTVRIVYLELKAVVEWCAIVKDSEEFVEVKILGIMVLRRLLLDDSLNNVLTITIGAPRAFKNVSETCTNSVFRCDDIEFCLAGKELTYHTYDRRTSI